jgi:hypothetical protein
MKAGIKEKVFFKKRKEKKKGERENGTFSNRKFRDFVKFWKIKNIKGEMEEMEKRVSGREIRGMEGRILGVAVIC